MAPLEIVLIITLYQEVRAIIIKKLTGSAVVRFY